MAIRSVSPVLRICSLVSTTPRCCFLTGAPLNVLSYGENHYKPDALYRSVHAEDHAIQRLPSRPSNKKRLHKLDILVVRVSKTGLMGNSKPCHHCLMLLSQQLPQRGYYISHVYFSNEQGDIQCMKLSTLLYHDEHHFSRFQKEQQAQLEEMERQRKIVKTKNRIQRKESCAK